jgi:hypothetical protein
MTSVLQLERCAEGRCAPVAAGDAHVGVYLLESVQPAVDLVEVVLDAVDF